LKTKLTNTQFSLEDEERDEQRYAVQFEALVHDQLRIIAQAKMTGDVGLVEMSVKHLEDILPTESRLRIKALSTEYILSEERWAGLPINGIKLSEDPYHPVIINKREDFDYDREMMGTRYEERENKELGEKIWVKIQERGAPHWMSPTMKEEKIIDHDVWLSLMVGELQEINAAWRQVRKARVESRIPPQDKPTPYHKGAEPPREEDSGAIVVNGEGAEPPNPT
jgi:hypothetical protein